MWAQFWTALISKAKGGNSTFLLVEIKKSALPTDRVNRNKQLFNDGLTLMHKGSFTVFHASKLQEWNMFLFFFSFTGKAQG